MGWWINGPKSPITCATCLDPKFRDPARAVRLGKELVEMAPKDSRSWTTLGVACYRAEDWKAAVDALDRAVKLSRKGGDCTSWVAGAIRHRTWCW